MAVIRAIFLVWLKQQFEKPKLLFLNVRKVELVVLFFFLFLLFLLLVALVVRVNPFESVNQTSALGELVYSIDISHPITESGCHPPASCNCAACSWPGYAAGKRAIR